MIHHPPKELCDKYYYYTDIFYEYTIGRLLDYYTKKLLDNNIALGIIEADDNDYDKNRRLRPHNKIYPYNNHIIYDYYKDNNGDINLYEFKFHIKETLSDKQKKYITSLFCEHDNYGSINYLGNVNNVKNWVQQFRFNDTGEITVKLLLNKAIIFLRKDKISKLL